MRPPMLFVLVILSQVAVSWPEVVAHRVVPAIYVFGDSTADVGNNNFLPNNKFVPNGSMVNYRPYGVDYPGGVPTGRWCNGYIAVDFIAMRLGFRESPPPALSLTTAIEESRGVSYASGGSGVLDETGQNSSISLNRQIMYFNETVGRMEKMRGRRQTRRRLSRSLFLFSTVNNDIFALFNNTLGVSNSTLQYHCTMFSTQFQKQLEMLYGLGARKVAVFGTGPLGCTPAARMLSGSATGDCFEPLNLVSQTFNFVMKVKLRALASKLQGFKYSYINSFEASKEIVDKAHEFGFREIKSPCCGSGSPNASIFCVPNSTYCSNRTEYLSWDVIHPTEAQYKRIVDLTYNSTDFAKPISFIDLVRAHI